MKYILIFPGILFSVLLANGQTKTLEDFIREGKANSPVLKDLSNQVKQNSTDSLIAKAGFKPLVSFNADAMYAPVINGYGYSDVITNGQDLTGTMNVSQDLFNKKRREAEFEKYGILNRSLLNEVRISENELEKEITGRYLDACQVYLEIDFSNQMLNAFREEQEILRKLVESGLYRQSDYLSFRIGIASLERNIKDLGIQYENALSSLNILCGIGDTTRFSLVLPMLAEKSAFPGTASPLFKRFQIDSLKIENQKTLIDRKYKPVFNWYSDAGLVNNEPRYIYQNFGISLGLSFKLPVYDGNQRKLNFSKLKDAEDTRKNYEDYFRLGYGMQVARLKSELEKTNSIIQDTQDQMKMNSELCGQDKALLNSGSVSITDYLVAIRNLLETHQVLVRYQVRSLQIINELNYWNQ